MRWHRVAAGKGLSNGLSTTIKYLLRTASGAAGNGKYLRRTRNGAAGNGLSTTIKSLRQSNAFIATTAVAFLRLSARLGNGPSIPLTRP
jgi:hypothetical protein